jgi:hypothetical protein
MYIKGKEIGIGLNISRIYARNLIVEDVAVQYFAVGLNLSDSNTNLFRSLNCNYNTAAGVTTYPSVGGENANTFENIQLYGNGGPGMYLRSGSYNLFNSVVAEANTGDGIVIKTANYNTFINYYSEGNNASINFNESNGYSIGNTFIHPLLATGEYGVIGAYVSNKNTSLIMPVFWSDISAASIALDSGCYGFDIMWPEWTPGKTHIAGATDSVNDVVILGREH